ncbi:methylated-DNA--[protein]-cysteine S-methyltransferase [Pseudooceanicola aestuarii]|uniref:methylated-DNA--[protein]-cysteine S-methyltransferase n=1 Tax=Pseudooceanicola aestuarii TaxID=2697319 RepID=UPI0013D6AFEA|nr:methylated-DNA--[protein]-cysteine S-methyltransferase [Pseudooceanicola aestuarii]
MATTCIPTPTGPLYVTAEGEVITRVTWRPQPVTEGADLLDQARIQLDAYFAGTRHAFDLPLEVRGSDLQKRVCAAMRAIPFGETTTYGAISRALGVPAQAIGQACGGNPMPVIIPCHRVLGATGLGGFSGEGGVETKVALLRHEGAAGLLI